jgi:hypothetical protein
MDERTHAPISEETMKRPTVYQTTQSNRAETALFAGLGVAVVISVVLGLSSMIQFVEGKDDAVALYTGNTSSGLAGLPAVRYVRSGQWKADARTLAAVVRWVLQPDVEGNNLTPLLASPTNSTSHAPKA